jgi:FKBP-type peptidyl-prolyl cis-trans isomerase FkpA
MTAHYQPGQIMRSAPRIVSRRVATAILSLTVVACLNNNTSPTPGSVPANETYAASLGVNLSQMTRLSDLLYTQDLVVGTGAAVAAGDSLLVSYTGWLVNGTTFGSDTAAALKFGVQHLIAGWDLGLVGIRVGGKRRLIVGSDLAYGAGGACSATTCVIPPNATLVFDVLVRSKIQ